MEEGEDTWDRYLVCPLHHNINELFWEGRDLLVLIRPFLFIVVIRPVGALSEYLQITVLLILLLSVLNLDVNIIVVHKI